MRELGSASRFLASPAASRQRSHRGGLADADRGHVVLHILHGVVNRHARRNRTARRIDVQLNVLLRIFLRQKQHLSDHQIGDVVVNRRADENNIVPQKAGVNVISPLTSARSVQSPWARALVFTFCLSRCLSRCFSHFGSLQFKLLGGSEAGYAD